MIPDDIAQQLPPIVEQRLIFEDDGARVWRVVLDDTTVLAVKATRDDSSGYGATRAAREVEALTAMGDEVTSHHLRAHGRMPTPAWLATEWIEGPTLHQRWGGLTPTISHEHSAAAQAAASGALALARLHDAGWRHGDIRGEHLLGEASEVRLIDFELAQGPPSYQFSFINFYRGGHPEMLAPEVAAEILATGEDHPVDLAPSAEVFSLGAAILRAWAGKALYGVDPQRYGELVRIVATGPTLTDLAPWPWPALQGLLADALDRSPANRPDAGELAAALTALT